MREYLGGRKPFYIIYIIIYNRLFILIRYILINIRVDINIIVNRSFSNKLKRNLQFKVYNNFNPGIVIPYKKASPNIINTALKGYLRVNSIIFLN